jgi:hypothetical protein
MPTSDDRPQLLIDTSVAVALAAAGHEYHHATRKAVGDRSCGLSGHAAFETFSVLTRLPPPNRRTPHAVARLLAHNFPGSRFLSAQGAASRAAPSTMLSSRPRRPNTELLSPLAIAGPPRPTAPSTSTSNSSNRCSRSVVVAIDVDWTHGTAHMWTNHKVAVTEAKRGCRRHRRGVVRPRPAQ